MYLFVFRYFRFMYNVYIYTNIVYSLNNMIILYTGKRVSFVTPRKIYVNRAKSERRCVFFAIQIYNAMCLYVYRYVLQLLLYISRHREEQHNVHILQQQKETEIVFK